jgi:hypothetical protein
MIHVDDLSRSLIAFEQISTLVIVVELSQSSWQAAGVVPGIERRPLKKLNPDPTTAFGGGLAGSSDKSWQSDHTDRSRFRVWSRWVLAGSMAADPWRRDLRHAFDECRGIARAPPSQDGSARY